MENSYSYPPNHAQNQVMPNSAIPFSSSYDGQPIQYVAEAEEFVGNMMGQPVYGAQMECGQSAFYHQHEYNNNSQYSHFADAQQKGVPECGQQNVIFWQQTAESGLQKQNPPRNNCNRDVVGDQQLSNEINTTMNNVVECNDDNERAKARRKVAAQRKTKEERKAFIKSEQTKTWVKRVMTALGKKGKWKEPKLWKEELMDRFSKCCRKKSREKPQNFLSKLIANLLYNVWEPENLVELFELGEKFTGHIWAKTKDNKNTTDPNKMHAPLHQHILCTPFTPTEIVLVMLRGILLDPGNFRLTCVSNCGNKKKNQAKEKQGRQCVNAYHYGPKWTIFDELMHRDRLNIMNGQGSEFGEHHAGRVEEMRRWLNGEEEGGRGHHHPLSSCHDSVNGGGATFSEYSTSNSSSATSPTITNISDGDDNWDNWELEQ